MRIVHAQNCGYVGRVNDVIKIYVMMKQLLSTLSGDIW